MGWKRSLVSRLSFLGRGSISVKGLILLVVVVVVGVDLEGFLGGVAPGLAPALVPDHGPSLTLLILWDFGRMGVVRFSSTRVAKFCSWRVCVCMRRVMCLGG